MIDFLLAALGLARCSHCGWHGCKGPETSDCQRRTFRWAQ